MAPTPTTISELLDRYTGVLLDAFGVLIDGSGVLPGAVALIRELDRRAMPFTIVTNDASRSGATYERKLAGLGMAVAAERFVTSGTLLPDFFRERGLAGARTCVLGTEDSREFVRAGGGVPVEVAAGMEIDAVAVCDDDGVPFLEGIERAASAVVRAVHAGRRPVLVAPNPDLIYPKSEGELGLTAGAMAVMIELAVGRKLPHAGLAFDRLGKPGPLLFTTAARRLGVPAECLVMIGDQLETDIAGANAAGIDSALVAGVSRWQTESTIAPTYLLATIHP